LINRDERHLSTCWAHSNSESTAFLAPIKNFTNR
jgi:hypothetical protein